MLIERKKTNLLEFAYFFYIHRFMFKLCILLQIIDGNTDQNTAKTSQLAKPIVAEYVRIHPQAWNNHISMRFDLLGAPGAQSIGKYTIKYASCLTCAAL